MHPRLTLLVLLRIGYVISGIGAVIVDHFRRPSPSPKVLRAKSWTPLEQATSKPDLQLHISITYPPPPDSITSTHPPRLPHMACYHIALIYH